MGRKIVPVVLLVLGLFLAAPVASAQANDALEEDSVRHRLVDSGPGLFLVPGALVEDDD